MPFVLRPATKEDAYQCGDVQLASYVDDPLGTALMKGLPLEEQAKFFAKSLIRDLESPDVRMVAIEDTDVKKIVGFALWHYPMAKSERNETGLDTMPFPEGSNFPLLEAIFPVSGKLAEKYYDSEKMYLLEYMQVRPEYQRRGLGRRLMEQGLKDADRDGAKVYLGASDAGKNLYVKDGFKTLEEVQLDFVHLGMSGVRNSRAMLREPQPI